MPNSRSPLAGAGPRGFFASARSLEALEDQRMSDYGRLRGWIWSTLGRNSRRKDVDTERTSAYVHGRS